MVIMPGRYLPGARELSGIQRVAVVSVTRRGERIDGDALVPAVRGYTRALHAAAGKAKPMRWVIVFVLIVARATTLWDAVAGSLGRADRAAAMAESSPSE